MKELVGAFEYEDLSGWVPCGEPEFEAAIERLLPLGDPVPRAEAERRKATVPPELGQFIQRDGHLGATWRRLLLYAIEWDPVRALTALALTASFSKEAAFAAMARALPESGEDELRAWGPTPPLLLDVRKIAR